MVVLERFTPSTLSIFNDAFHFGVCHAGVNARSRDYRFSRFFCGAEDSNNTHIFNYCDSPIAPRSYRMMFISKSKISQVLPRLKMKVHQRPSSANKAISQHGTISSTGCLKKRPQRSRRTSMIILFITQMREDLKAQAV